MTTPGSSPSDPTAGQGDGASREVPEHLVVGQVTKAHGTRGEVLVWPLTDSEEEVFAAGSELVLGDAEGELGPSPEPLTVERARPFRRGLLVKFEEIEDRTRAEEVARRYLLASTEQLAPLTEGEVFYHQLLGLEVFTTEGWHVGRVREVYDAEPADLLEVKGERRLHLIPFLERIVREIDLEGGRLVIDPPPGLLDV